MNLPYPIVFSFETQLDKEDSYSTKRIFIEGFQRIFKQIKKEKINQIFENITYSSNRNEIEDKIYEREAHKESNEKNDKNRKIKMYDNQIISKRLII